MAQQLPSKGLTKKLHIALFSLVFLFGIQLQAQSVLLPGDVVVVSVNADTQAVDIIPIIDIKQGTELYLSDGTWNDSTSILSGNELKITFIKPIQAGTNIHVNELDDKRISISGKVEFEGPEKRLFVYQKESEIHRFIFAIGWGTAPTWKSEQQDSLGSDIPSALSMQDHVLLSLGIRNNYQYYVRNGASGTRSMLLKYVGDESHWRGKDDAVYTTFGTSFKLLEPPVVLFENSVSTVMEDDSAAILNVSIYEHDGSRLTVDVLFDSLQSISSGADIGNFSKATVNFTGLVGDAIYEVKVPITDDDIYEGRESGIFTLKNLTKGNYGDFLSHSLILQDNDVPELKIVNVQNSAENPPFAELTNEGEVAVSLKNWSIVSAKNSYTIQDDIYIEPQKSLLWVDAEANTQAEFTVQHLFSKVKNRFIERNGGMLKLLNPAGKTISEFRYSAVKADNQLANSSVSSKSNVSQNAVEMTEGNADVVASGAQAESKRTGWKVIKNHDQVTSLASGIPLYSWDQELLEFSKATDVLADESISPVLFGYYTESEQQAAADFDSLNRNSLMIEDNLEFTLSAKDENDNERIDGLEGLNLVYNQFDIPITAGRFINLIKTANNEVEIHPVIYSIRNSGTGGLNYVEVESYDAIAPGEAFWLLIDTPLEEQTFRIDKSDFEDVVQQPLAEEEEFNQEEGRIYLQVEAGGYLDSVEVVVSDSVRGLLRKDLNSYPGLFLPDHSFINIAYNSSEEFFETISVVKEMEQKMILPLNISTSESGVLTFKTTTFEQIPSDWRVQLEDKRNGKMYDLRKDATFSFKFTSQLISERADENDFPNLLDYTIQDRFYLHISPHLSESEAIEEEIDEPRTLELHQNFPNPFNPVTTISFYLPEVEEIKLSVFNIVGQPVAVIAQGSMSAGEHQFEWDATDKPSGMYIYQLEVGKSVMTRKMTLVK